MRKWVVALLLSCVLGSATAFTNMMYVDDVLSADSFSNQAVLDDISQHHQAMQILSPQIYSVNQKGTVWGSLSPRAAQLCKQYHIQLMPLLINQDFKQDMLHQFLHDPVASKSAIAQLISICQRNHYMGFQLDIENIDISDKLAFTQFVQRVAAAFHQQGLKLSTTIVPASYPPNLSSQYEAWVYDNWSGGYDLNALAKVCDFVTIMAYDRHTSLTTPGPIAPLSWVRSIVKSTLKVVPANKVLLGIPFYSGYWMTGTMKVTDTSGGKTTHFQGREHQISYQSVLSLQQQYKTQAKWDSASATAFAVLREPGGLYGYLYVQNARSVARLLKLAKRYHLMGISAWQLGMEDPKVWPLLAQT